MSWSIPVLFSKAKVYNVDLNDYTQQKKSDENKLNKNIKENHILNLSPTWLTRLRRPMRKLTGLMWLEWLYTPKNKVMKINSYLWKLWYQYLQQNVIISPAVGCTTTKHMWGLMTNRMPVLKQKTYSNHWFYFAEATWGKCDSSYPTILSSNPNE
jgi:hypothetical protein